MDVVSEPVRIERWLRTVLLADPVIANIVGTRVYSELAPDDVLYPVIVLRLLSPGADVRGTGPVRIWARPVYIVEGIMPGTQAAALQTLADRIDVVLHGQRGGVAGLIIDYCVRRSPFRRADYEGGTVWQRLGGLYEVGARAA